MQQLSLFQKAKELPKRSVSVAAYRGESHVLRLLCSALIFCVCAYLYFIGLSIMNLVGSREALARSNVLKSEVATLEQEYFRLSKAVTPNDAISLGLTKPVKTTFVRADAGGVARVVESRQAQSLSISKPDQVVRPYHCPAIPPRLLPSRD